MKPEKKKNGLKYSPRWDFKLENGSPYFTINPEEVPQEWKYMGEPADVFDVPEIWYGVERRLNPEFEDSVAREVEFCSKLWEKYSDKPVESVLEVCCGIMPHGSVFASKGINVVGVDASKGMVEAAEVRARVQKLPMKAYHRNVFQFSIPGSSPDAAVLLGRSFPLPRDNKIDNSALAGQIRSVGTFLKRDTLYIIDLGSPLPPPIVVDYEMSKPMEVDLGFAEVTLTCRTFPTDIETMVTPSVAAYDVHYPGGDVRLERRGASGFVSCQHLSALVDLSGVFKLEAFHHWGSIEPGLGRDGGPCLAVLRRI